MNPTEDIPHGTAPATSAPPAGKPASGIASPPVEKNARAKSTPDGIPADLTNLALAAGLLLSAFLIFWMGLYLANHVAMLSLLASFGTFALVYVLHRLRVFHRPHGGLIATGAVALFAAALPFIGRGFQKLDHAAKTGLAGEPAKPEGEMAAQLPVPTRQTIPEPPVPTAPAPQEDDVVRELIAPTPDPSAGRLIRVIQDAKVSINGRKFLIRAGSEFPLKEFKDGTVTFQAGNQEVTIDSAMVKFTGKSKETPEEIRKLAEAEAMRRYPAIGVKDSDENQLYLTRVADLKSEMPDLMKDPHWPLLIAEQLAAQEGWKRADQPADDTAPAAPGAEERTKAPRQPLPPEPSDPSVPPLPPTPSNVPQEAPPTAK